jgi:hypothetical protein
MIMSHIPERRVELRDWRAKAKEIHESQAQ